jgi:hypothetical protein
MCRRHLLAIAGVSAGATLLARRPLLAGTSFESITQIDAGVLNVGYAEAGQSNGPVVLLLHGWPYDIHSHFAVAPLLASAGYRVVVPYLRGYGATRFLSGETMRNGQQSAIAVDIIALMDALGIEKAIIADFERKGCPGIYRFAESNGMVCVSGMLYAWRHYANDGIGDRIENHFLPNMFDCTPKRVRHSVLLRITTWPFEGSSSVVENSRPAMGCRPNT